MHPYCHRVIVRENIDAIFIRVYFISTYYTHYTRNLHISFRERCCSKCPITVRNCCTWTCTWYVHVHGTSAPPPARSRPLAAPRLNLAHTGGCTVCWALPTGLPVMGSSSNPLSSSIVKTRHRLASTWPN